MLSVYLCIQTCSKTPEIIRLGKKGDLKHGLVTQALPKIRNSASALTLIRIDSKRCHDTCDAKGIQQPTKPGT